ncbi:hypothetical protein J7E95_02665 [Streptomyces sp. ISL-14]|nr:hypothetical protein [Streptomyces sp. ISL-14]
MSIIERFSGIPTTCISDTMKGLNNLSPAIKPVKDVYQDDLHKVKGGLCFIN